MNLRDDTWIRKLKDGRLVKFTYMELPEDGAFLTAQIERHHVVYSVLLASVVPPPTQKDVEGYFNHELSKK